MKRRDGVFKRNGAWWIDYTDADGKRRRRKAAPTYELAKLIYRDTVVAVAKGHVVGTRGESSTLRRFVETRYWPTVSAELSPRWRARSKDILDRVLLPTLGPLPLARIRTEDIERWLATRRGIVSSTTLRKELARLKHALTRAVKWRLLAASPAAEIPLPKERPGRVRYLADGEREVLLAHAHRRLRPWIIMALGTGGRVSELARLRWADVDLHTGMITFRETKTGTSRSVPLTETVRELLRAGPRPLRAEQPLLPPFPTVNDVSRRFGRLAARCGLRNLHFHDLRHDVASRLTMHGVPLRAVQDLLGHTSPRMTARYSHLSPDFLRQAMAVLDRPTGGSSPSAPFPTGTISAPAAATAPQGANKSLRIRK
jgi:integrase